MPAIQFQWHFGGTYFATPDKLDHQDALCGQARAAGHEHGDQSAGHRQALLGGKVQPIASWVSTPSWTVPSGRGSGIRSGTSAFEELYGYDPTKAKALLKQAGYPQGFEFTLYLYTLPGLPEIIDIGQAMALDCQAIGLKPKLVEIDFPRVRELYRSKTIHGAAVPHAPRLTGAGSVAHRP